MTPAVTAVRAAGLEHRLHDLGAGHAPGDEGYALAAARDLGVEPERVFKTLVADVDGALVVAVLPATETLDLRALGKRAAMARPEQAERATGYVTGGISPVGQRRRLPTFVDETALLWDTVFVSAGRRGLELELAPGDLVALTGATVRDVSRGR